MDLTDKTAQPSMEEILASIRKLLSEESVPAQQEIDFNARPIRLADDEEDEAATFDLPAIFRSSSGSMDRHRNGASRSRLTDAIRSVAGGVFDTDVNVAHAVETPKHLNGLSSLRMEETSEPREQLVAAQAAPERRAELVGASAGLDDVSFFEEVAPQSSGASPYSSQPFQPRVEAQPQSQSQSQPQALVQQPAAMASSSNPSDVRRVMAPFKDTKFMALSSPESPASAPEPVVEARVAPRVDPVLPQLHRAEPETKREPVLPSFPPLNPVHNSPLNGSKQGLSASFPQAANAHREEIPQSQGIEEAAADLLRPMLRSWLAENMPKMVEKALVLEMNQQLANLKKTGGPTG